MENQVKDQMKYQTGDIIIVNGTIFKDSGLYDTRIYGRPVIVLYSNEDVFYYLTMSTRTENIDMSFQFYILEYGNWLNKENHYGNVNCRNIYKRCMEHHSVRTRLDYSLLSQLFYKFTQYQETVRKDEFYDEIKDEVKRYIR